LERELALITFTAEQVNIEYNTTVNSTTGESSSWRLEYPVLYVFTVDIAIALALVFV
jgi:hypothetical protein